MGTDQVAKRRRAWAGGTVAGLASLGLISFPLLARAELLSDKGMISLVFGLTIAMGCGAILMLFSLAGDHNRPI